MKWKEFLKPDKERIVLFVVALFFLSIFFRFSPMGNTLGYKPSLLDEILVKLWVVAFLINLLPGTIFWPFYNNPVIFIILFIIFWYLISCSIVWVFDHRRKEK